jgi:hypothetical protein
MQVAIRAEQGWLVPSQRAVAEADYPVLTRLEIDVELAFLFERVGTFAAERLTPDELVEARDVVVRRRDPPHRPHRCLPRRAGPAIPHSPHPHLDEHGFSGRAATPRSDVHAPASRPMNDGEG